jgi:hypothetical protein
LWVSPCVTATIAAHCQFSHHLTGRTAAVLVIHDWGLPHPRLGELHTYCTRHGLPLIEDVAHAFASRDASGHRLGTTGDFALFSLPKYFPIGRGGLAIGLPSDTGDTGDLSDVAAALASWLPHEEAIAQRRVACWQQLDTALGQLGLRSALPLAPGTVPMLYVLATARQFATIREFGRHGVETGPDAYCGNVLLPCHQDVSKQDVARMVAAISAAHHSTGKVRMPAVPCAPPLSERKATCPAYGA